MAFPANSNTALFRGVGLSFLLLGTPTVFAQELPIFKIHPDYTVRQFTVHDGLPVNVVRAVTSTSDGYLWIGTEEGVGRFDGKQFTNYTTTGTSGLAGNLVAQIVPGPEGTLWVISLPNKLSLFQKGYFREIPSANALPPNYPCVYVTGDTIWVMTTKGLSLFEEGVLKPFWPDIITSEVTSVTQDAAGRLWVGTREEGLYRLDLQADTTHSERTFVRFTEADGLPSKHIVQVFLLKDGTPWIATARGGLARIIDDGVDVLRQPDGAGVLAWHEDEEGFIWYAVDVEGWWSCAPSGPCTLLPLSEPHRRAHLLTTGPDGARWRVERLTSNARSVGGYERLYRDDELIFEVQGYVSNIFFDEDDNLWIWSSRKGLFRIRKSLIQTVDRTHGLPTNTVSAILEDRDGTIWIGMLDRGLVRLDQHREGIVPIELPPDWTRGQRSVLVLYEDRNGVIWVGGSGSLCTVTGNRCVAVDLPIHREATLGIRSILEDRKGRLWISSTGRLAVGRADKGWRWWLENNGNPVGSGLRSMYEATDGTLLFGKAGDGLSYYRDEREGRGPEEHDPLIDEEAFESYAREDGLPAIGVRGFYEDGDGYTWLTMIAGGLCRVDLEPGIRFKEAEMACVDSQSGFHSDSPIGMLEDDQGRFWFNSNNGMFWVKRADVMAYLAGRIPAISSVSYKEAEGMPSRLGNGGNSAAIRTRDGRLWFLTNEGVVHVNPEEMPFPEAPTVLIESVQLKGEDHPINGPIFLEAHDRDISINYTALEFKRPDDLRFQYKLEGYDDAWQNAGGKRQATYTNLAPGAYAFRVRAEIAGAWSEEATLTIERAPFFWQTGWFTTLVVLFFAIVGPMIYWYRVRQLKKREAALEHVVAERTAELKQANEIKSRFLANISHEFRTPLTLTFGPLDDLLQGRFKVEEAARPYLEGARRNGRKILRLINQLLDLSKLDAGALLLRPKQYDLAQHIRQIAALFESLAETREIDFVIQIPVEPFLHVYDADKLEKVITNLLSNAFKFTPKGGKVSIALDQKEDDIAEITSPEIITAKIIIADAGVGIAKEHLPHLFDRFYQVESDIKRSYEGTGIGLALVKELVELHEGTIEVTSTVGFGTSFLVQIPSSEPADMNAKVSELNSESVVLESGVFDLEPEARKQPQTRDHSAIDTRQSAQILIIEDNADMRTYIRGHLDESYTILEAANGREGVERAIEMVPDLILSDVMMPEMDGLEACAAIKADERTSHIPVVLLTARAQVEHRIVGFESGADAYLPKPFYARELLVRVRTLIKDRQKLRERFITWSQEPKAEDDRGLIKKLGAREDQIEHAAGTLDPPPDVPNSVLLPPREVAFLEKVEALLDEHLGNSQFGLDQMAEALMMSRRQLQRKMRALTSERPTAMLRQKRLARAATLLKSNEMTIKEVCFSVGFQSKSSFARAFREVYGKSPSEYREQ